MSTTPCPHCGFQNFAVSAYCSRCERPLKANAVPLASALREASHTDPLVGDTLITARPGAGDTQLTQRVLADAQPTLDLALDERAPEDAAGDTQVKRREPPVRTRGTSDTQVDTPRVELPPTAPPRSPLDDAVTVVMQRPPMFPTPKEALRAVTPPPPPLDDLTATVVTRVPSLPPRAAVPPAAPKPAPKAAPAPVIAKPPPPVRVVGAPPAALAPAAPAAPAPPVTPKPLAASPAPPPPGAKSPVQLAPGASMPSSLTPPTAPIPAEPPVVEVGRTRVVLALLIDLAVVGAVGALVGWLEVTLGGSRWAPHAGIPFDVFAQWLSAHASAVTHGLLAAASCGLLYHGLHGLRGWPTLGRRLTGTTLARKSGKPVTILVVATRTALSVVSLALFGAGFFWMLVDRRGRGWHDLASGTLLASARHSRVVRSTVKA